MRRRLFTFILNFYVTGDWRRTIRHFLTGMRQAYGWQAPYIPRLEVRD
jgi:hypothetical protein